MTQNVPNTSVTDSPATSSWLRPVNVPSLAEVHRTIRVSGDKNIWRRALTFIGPGYLVAVGYMDPGNWATSIAGGAQFGYSLLFVALLSNIMAIILQSLCARLAIGADRDLAQACRDAYSKPVAVFLWILAELAIIATDIAEVVGTAIGLNLLFNIPLEAGVIITVLDVFVIFLLQRLGFRWVEAFIIGLLGVIFACFYVQLAMADPDWRQVILGFAPTMNIVGDKNMLYLALGIIGATVMPHNLYLHSGIVQTRAYGKTISEKREALKFATYDSTIALCFALSINAAILILAAAAFNKNGHIQISELNDAHALLSSILGSMLAPKLFAIALLCCGLNSTITATMAGQIVMEGFLNIRLAAWLRRLITRMIAIIPSAAITLYYGSEGTTKLLIFSQVVLAFQLPFAVIPLVAFTKSRAKLGALSAPWWLTVLAGLVAALVIALNVKFLYDFALD